MNASEHARKVRNAKRTGIFLTMLAFAIGTPLAIKMAGTDTNNFAGPGGNETPITSPTGTPSDPGIVDHSALYVDAELNVVFPVPTGWKVGEFEGHRTAHPSDVPAPPQDGDTAYVSLAYGDLAPTQGREPTTFAGLPAQEVTTGNQHWIVVEAWPLSPYSMFGKPMELSIWSDASSQGLAEENADGFDMILQGAQPLWDADGNLAAGLEPSAMETRRGGASSGVELNGASAAVAGFMDTRAWVEDTGAYVSDEAIAQYRELEMPDGTQRDRYPEKYFLQDYRIVSMDAADANSYEVVVEIVFSDMDQNETTITERLFVGPGTAADDEDRAFVIRGVEDVS